MFLTRFRIHTARREARLLLGSPRRLHGAVNMAFPKGTVRPGPGGGRGPRVLWRVDANSRSETLLYVVSPERPDLTHLVEQAGWPTTGNQGWDTYEYDSFLDALAEGDTWAFRLTANPVHSIRRKDDEPIKRTAHRTPWHQMRWLLDRQEKAGFAVLERPADQRLLPEDDEHLLIVRDRRDLRFGKTDGDRNHTVSLTAVTFEGRLRVTDAKLLRETLTSGLGKGKAYGCGLMTLAPVR
jgi:CRISPR system Cascade subunit CasE